MAEETKKSVEETDNKPEEKEAETPEAAPEETKEGVVDSKETAENSDDSKKTAEEVTEKVVEEINTSNLDQLKPGMVVRVHLKIKEVTPKGDERERIQIFEGMIIAKKGQDKNSATITVRKVSKGFGIERIFPLRMPAIAKIETVRELRVRRSKLYYTRDKRKKKLKDVKPKGDK